MVRWGGFTKPGKRFDGDVFNPGIWIALGAFSELGA
jgi:hypothetical protein